jgi:hypothetical protein
VGLKKLFTQVVSKVKFVHGLHCNVLSKKVQFSKIWTFGPKNITQFEAIYPSSKKHDLSAIIVNKMRKI